MKRFLIILFSVLISVLTVSCEIDEGETPKRDKDAISNYAVSLFEYRVPDMVKKLSLALLVDSYIASDGENPDGGTTEGQNPDGGTTNGGDKGGGTTEGEDIYEYIKNNLKHIDETKLFLPGLGTVETAGMSLHEAGTVWTVETSSDRDNNYYNDMLFNGGSIFKFTCLGNQEWTIKQVDQPSSLFLDVVLGAFEGMEEAAKCTIEGTDVSASGGISSSYYSGEDGIVFGYADETSEAGFVTGGERLIYGDFYVETFCDGKPLDSCALSYKGDTFLSNVSIMTDK